MHDLYGLVSESQHALGSKRAMLIRIENEGDIYNPKGRKFITVKYESYDYPFPPARPDFKRYPIDEAYNGMLTDLLDEKRLLLDPNDLRFGFLKTYYESNGILFSDVFVVHESKGRLVFASYNFIKEDVDPRSAVHLAMVNKYKHLISEVIAKRPELMD